MIRDVRVQELAEELGATFEGDGELDIRAAATLESATLQEVAFVSSARFADQAHASRAGCLIAGVDFIADHRRAIIRAAEPRLAFARAIALLHPAELPSPGIHPTATIAAGARVAASAAIGPHVSVDEGASIDEETVIGPGCSVGKRVRVGRASRLHANVAVYDDVEIGSRVILHSGCVIGADGFGFAMAAGCYQKFPQIGRVVIGDDVEIGANSCVDRAALGVTSIGEGTKLDNMVHVGHNCSIGKHVVVAAQTGFSGGVVVEDYAVIGGQVGIGDKARIESRAVLGSGCGVLTSKIIRSGQTVWGTPARPLREHLEQLANLARLPELRKQIHELRRQIDMLTRKG
jgi:UDP-3-O-[3-hydroxymyristoyl] glucosamine N-acyltransferase